MHRKIYWFFLLLISKMYSQQVIIKGLVVNAVNQQPIPFASVIVQQPDNTIIDYTQTDEQGAFHFNKKFKKGVYKLVLRHLSYKKVVRTLVIKGENSKISLEINLQENTNNLDEVLIEAPKPILIKKDTIIYDVKQFAKQKEQSLEEVLGDIDGIKVLPNGEIKVNGHYVKKVLVNGKEVSNNGASILTKSIDSKRVQSVEVRFNEQNNKLKESLLDTKEFVVLDIKLKESVKTSLFGKVRLTSGYQNNINAGYYTNLFSLKDGQNLHFFSEYDAFGTQTISLKNIRNIGQESFSKLFEIPADFESLTQKENYQSEIFNFDGFSTYKRGVTGVSFLKELTSNWSLFFGSYNAFFTNEKEENMRQIFNDAVTNRFDNHTSINDFSSKNKLEFKYNTDKNKIVINTNLVYNRNLFNENSAFSLENQYYNIDKNNTNINLYNNVFFEHKFNSKWGVSVKLNNTYINRDEQSDFCR